MKSINIIDQKFGKLLVKKLHSKTRNGHERYVCLCDCGNFCNILKTHLRQNNTKSCGCDKPFGKNHHQWKGYEEISADFWYNHVVRSANGDKGRRKPLVLEITIKDAWELFVKQKSKCALSGIFLKFPKKNNDLYWTASLDRIDSSKGYVEGNVQWVHKDINIMKNKFNQEYFINVCKQIAQRNFCELPN